MICWIFSILVYLNYRSKCLASYDDAIFSSLLIFLMSFYVVLQDSEGKEKYESKIILNITDLWVTFFISNYMSYFQKYFCVWDISLIFPFPGIYFKLNLNANQLVSEVLMQILLLRRIISSSSVWILLCWTFNSTFDTRPWPAPFIFYASKYFWDVCTRMFQITQTYHRLYMLDSSCGI